MGKILAISTNKGGVLKTSITTNLAGAMASQYRTLIIDTDNQGNVALSFGINPDQQEITLYDVLINEVDVKTAIINVHKTAVGCIDILPANDDMAFFEFDILTERDKYKNPFALLRNAIEVIKNDYDYILIDTPPNIGLTQGNVLSVADWVLIPFQPESYSMRSLIKILAAINNFKEKHNPSINVLGVVATLIDQRTVLHSQVLQEARKYCLENGIKIFDTVIPRSVRYAASVAYERKPATLVFKHKDKLVSSYFELLKEIEYGTKE